MKFSDEIKEWCIIMPIAVVLFVVLYYAMLGLVVVVLVAGFK